MAAGAEISVLSGDFPARITDAYIRVEAPRMSPGSFDEFLAVLGLAVGEKMTSSGVFTLRA